MGEAETEEAAAWGAGEFWREFAGDKEEDRPLRPDSILSPRDQHVPAWTLGYIGKSTSLGLAESGDGRDKGLQMVEWFN